MNASSSATSTSADAMLEFDKHCETLLSDNLEEGWASELGRYLNTMQWDVKKDTDIVEWWQVRTVICPYPSSANPSSVEPCPIISYACSYCTRRPPVSSSICPMWTVVFGYQANCRQPLITAQFQSLWRTCNHGICMGAWALRFRRLEHSPSRGDSARQSGTASWWHWRFWVGKGVGFNSFELEL